MTSYSVADAKNSLPKLIDRAIEGEEVVITRHGKPVVEIRRLTSTRAPSAGVYEWLRARRLPSVGLTSVQLLDAICESEEG